MSRISRRLRLSFAVLATYLAIALLVSPVVQTQTFSCKKSATLSESQSGTADSTDWPLAIALDGTVQAADPDLKTVGNGGYVQSALGYDIRPYSDSGLTTPLTYELVFYDGATGTLEMHVKIPTLSTTTDTVIYLAFGDSGISTDGSSTSTWNSDVVGVWHVADGTTLNTNDATAGANNGTNNGATATTGQLDGGASIGTAHYISIANESNFDFNYNSPFTVEAWVNVTTFTPAIQGIFSKLSDVAPFPGWELDLYNSGQGTSNGIGIFLVNAYPLAIQIETSATAPFPTNTWLNVGATYTGSGDASGVVVYASGVPAGVNVIINNLLSGSILNNLSPNLGARYGTSAGPINGKIDEVRVHKVARSASWMIADFNAQKTSSDFVTWGSVSCSSPPAIKRLLMLGIG